MNVMVVGLGSMGRRRIRLMKTRNEVPGIVGVDLSEARREAAMAESGIRTAASIAEALRSGPVDAAFVCTSPLTHAGIISECLGAGLHVFTELNLVADGYADNLALAERQGRVLFLSSTFLYREEVDEIRRRVAQAAGPLDYTYHVGQYLPDWHPWESYKDFFVADRRTNGCREIFAIELPWLTDVFGPVARLEVSKSRRSGLDLGYEDSYLLLLEHASGHKGLLAVDVVSRKAVRDLTLYGERLFLRWDGSPTGLSVYDYEAKRDVPIRLYEEVHRQEGYGASIVENAYAKEISTFFAVLEGQTVPPYDFRRDRDVLALIDRIEA